MRRIYAYNIFCNFVDFLKNNRVKFIVSAIIFLCGIAVGIASGVNVSNVNKYLFSHNSNTFRLILGSKSVVSYFFWRFLTLTLLAIIIVLLSFNFYLAFVGYLFLFFFVFIFSMYLTLYVVFFKVVILPLMALCLAPCMLAIYFVLSVLVVMSFNRGKELKCYGCNSKINFLFYIKTCLPMYACIVCVLLIESLLAFILTLGIAI